ncbi:hypothetical protein [Methanosphaera cuniculi]|uniref:hypothetical protein n=1 Tax=Methanosphaera cuniculi TaxID=1077256 RepID=UPI0026DBCC16|nr:hypothetical protein [Methanosphaera cuniculi]
MAKHTMKIISGMQPTQVQTLIDTYSLQMVQTKEGLIYLEGELEDLRHATKHVVDVTLPPGPTVTEIKNAVDKYDIALKQSDDGPVFHGTLFEINEAINYLVDQMSERLGLSDD